MAAFFLAVNFRRRCFFTAQSAGGLLRLDSTAGSEASRAVKYFPEFQKHLSALLNMAYTQPAQSLIDRHVWVQPEMMLQLYFHEQYKGDAGNDRSLVIGATLLDFTSILNTKMCRIGPMSSSPFLMRTKSAENTGNQ